MIEALIILSCAIALSQNTDQRFLIAILYSGLAALHMTLDPRLSDVNYYLVAGAFDITIVLAIFIFSRQTRFTDGMVIVASLSFLSNCYGWIIYELSIGPISFIYVSALVYIMGIGVLLGKDKADGTGEFSWSNILRVPVCNLGRHYHKLYRKAQTCQ